MNGACSPVSRISGSISGRNFTHPTVQIPGTCSDYGAANSALEALLLDLDISREAFEKNHDLRSPRVSKVTTVDDGKGLPVILLVMEWQCPDWFEPTTRRLSLNDPVWWDISAKPNDNDSFELWSLSVMDLFSDRRQSHCGS
jgi:hypothetical protein